MNIDYEQLVTHSRSLAEAIPKGKYKAVLGIPNGGTLPAFIVAQILQVPLFTMQDYRNIEDSPYNRKDVLIVDDLIDSGATLLPFKDHDIAVVYVKENAPAGLYKYYVKEVGKEWVGLPHETADTPIEQNITRILQYIGENPKREGLQETPKRVIKSFEALFGGYKQDIKDVLTVFEKESYDQMVLLKDIEFYSTCEHHMLPFFGKAHVAYVPKDKIVGISKLARVVEIFSRRLQNQERLTDQVAKALQDALDAQGVAVVMEAKHFCMVSRGVQKQNSTMKTSSLTGCFLEKPQARAEFFDLIK